MMGAAVHVLLLLGVIPRLSTGSSIRDLPPRILRDPESQFVRRGGSVTLSCGFEPIGAKVIWLFYEDRKLPEGASERDKSLHIETFNKQHVGLYQCVVQSGSLMVLSAPASLEFAKIKDFDNEKEGHVAVVEGNTAVISCNITSKPTAMFSFSKNGILLDTNNDDRLHVMSFGNLHIERARKSDAGQYVCHAENKVIGKTKSSAATTLVVKDKEDKISSPVIKGYKTYSLMAGDDLNLECSASGSPPPRISWWKLDAQGARLTMSPTKYPRIGGSVLLKSASIEDSGGYVCRAENVAGDDEAILTVEIYDRPHVRIESRDRDVSSGFLRVEQGERVTLTCPCECEQTQWYRNLTTVWSGKKYMIQSIQPSQSDVYQCFGVGEYGIAQASIYIVVTPSKRPAPTLNTDMQYLSTHTTAQTASALNDILSWKPEVRVLNTTKLVTQVLVMWSSARPDIESFRVQHRQRCGRVWHHWIHGSNVYPVERVARNSVVVDLDAGCLYRFRIAVIYGGQRVATSRETTIDLAQSTDPKPSLASLDAPVISVCERFENDAKVKLQWKADIKIQNPFDGIKGFKIEYEPYGEPANMKTVNVSSTERKHVFKGLQRNASYTFRMKAFGFSDAESPYSNSAVCDPNSDQEEFETPIKRIEPEEEKEDPVEFQPTEQRPVSKSRSRSNLMYMILGILLGIVVLLVAFFIVCTLRHRRRRRSSNRQGDKLRQNIYEQPRITTNGDHRLNLPRESHPLNTQHLEIVNDLDSDEIKPEISSSGSSSSCSANSGCSLNRRPNVLITDSHQPLIPEHHPQLPLTSFTSGGTNVPLRMPGRSSYNHHHSHLSPYNPQYDHPRSPPPVSHRTAAPPRLTTLPTDDNIPETVDSRSTRWQ